MDLFFIFEILTKARGGGHVTAGAQDNFQEYRRFPNRQHMANGSAANQVGACGFGNPRYSRLGSLRYEQIPMVET
jgi:hypothetical protein